MDLEIVSVPYTQVADDQSQQDAMQNCVAIQLTGEVDVSNADDLRFALTHALDAAYDEIVVDIKEVSYIDSTGIGVLVGAAHTAKDNGCVLRVINPQDNVARVLKLLGVSKELRCA